MRTSHSAGFTLLELLIVIALLGITAAIALPRFINLQTDARISVLRHMQAAVATGAMSVHSSAVLANLDLTQKKLTVDLDGDGTDEQLAYGYPNKTHAHTMRWIIIDMGDFSYTPGRYFLKANCHVTYDNPPATGAVPQITLVTSGC